MASPLLRKLRKVPEKIPQALTGGPLFRLWERLGLHVVPNHYYHPIPDTRTLTDALWERPSEMVGVDLGLPAQLQLLDTFQQRFREEYDGFPEHRTGVPHEFYLLNTGFRAVDAEVLYCMVRHFGPRRILEIGSGFSTLVSAKAAVRNSQESPPRPCEVVAVEPYPDDLLRAGFPGLARLVPQRVQDLPLSEFESLERNDILFIDSSHVLKTGGDVRYEYLEVLPRLKPGVLVHIHDIFLPYEYPKEWLLRYHRFWTEQYLLQALLTHSSAFEVLWSGHYLHRQHPQKLQAAFRSYHPDRVMPGSFWIRRL